eukprot:TRINITY_DN988_c0_g1_i1.p2 TRINITY_DN988_c0_g1~~TRINITY_DN988_c0_g1_i1.p2  ORF type:complete len:286 (-),score=50.37 TRINITY_DN988_c0_g1_i1:238-1095(-)
MCIRDSTKYTQKTQENRRQKITPMATRTRENNYDHAVKLLMLGESGVGKSSLLLRFAEDKFSSTFLTTLGVEYKQKVIQVNNSNTLVQVWDTAGQERFRTITPIYYRSVDGVILVYDVADRHSFESVSYWIKNLQDYGDPNIITILVGNKADLVERKHVTTEEGVRTAEGFKMNFVETSAKNNSGVNETFAKITEQILERRMRNAIEDSPGKPSNSPTEDLSASRVGGQKLTLNNSSMKSIGSNSSANAAASKNNESTSSKCCQKPTLLSRIACLYFYTFWFTSF